MSLELDDLVSYYASLPESGGFDSRCEMYLPGGLDSKTALDLACRKGLGVYKISDAVGPAGHVIGVDWREAFIDKARAGEAHAAEKNGLSKSNMEFVVSYPEMLGEAGIEAESLDFVYVNSVLNLFYDPAAVIAQVGRLLKPAGLLVCQTVLATTPRDGEVIEQARKIGNVVQAAPNRKDFARWLHAAGMDMPTCQTIDARPIAPDAAVTGDVQAPVVATDEHAQFTSCVMQVEKLGGFDYQELLRQDISQFR